MFLSSFLICSFSGDYLDSAQFNTMNLLQYNNRAYDRLTIRMLLERQPQFYLSKIVSGSMLLVYMCVWVFSLAVDEADRMMVRTHESNTLSAACATAAAVNRWPRHLCQPASSHPLSFSSLCSPPLSLPFRAP